MDLYFYNTLTRRKEKFKSIDPRLVKMYTCGPTVYRDTHLGNFRTYIMADLARRVLEFQGYQVRKIQNFTDVGHMRRSEENSEAFDPVIKSALESGKTPLEITQGFAQQFLADARYLNIIEADVYPKASEHIPEMIKIIEELLAKGFAYDTGENIYFDVAKFPAYGRLSGNTLEKMEKLLAAVRVASETDKTDSADFVLWKRVGPDYLMKWESPWGLGSPGWHIECTAMSIKYLGRPIDIHTGGEDNIFPHHEDEIAQSEAWTGERFVNFWLHGGHLLVDNEKMARRRGNVYLVQDLIDRGFSPLVFRYLTFNSYYRSKMNFTWSALESAQKALNRLQELMREAQPAAIGCAEYEERFRLAVSHDLNLPLALSIVWEMVSSSYPTSAKKASLLQFDKVLGLGLDKEKMSLRIPLPALASVASLSQVDSSKVKKVTDLAGEMELARRDGDYEKSDRIRRELERMGYGTANTKDGPKIFKKEP